MTHSRILIAYLGQIFAAAAAYGCASLLDIESDSHVVDASAGSGGTGGTAGTGGSSGTDGTGGGPPDAGLDGPAVCTGTLSVRLLADLTGATSSVSVPYFKGELDLIREINETGGIRGCQIDYEYRDYVYDPAKAEQAYNEWKAGPKWADVSAIFGFGSGDTLRISPLAAADKKVVISGSYIGELASPLPVNFSVQVPEIAADFQELYFEEAKKSGGYPYNFFAGTDYSTAIRIAAFFVRSKAGKRIAFFHCTASYCTGPLAAGKTYAKHPTVELAIGRDLVLELTETQADYDTKVLEYFQQEIEHKNANPSYQMVDWIWMANTSKTTAYLGKSLQKVRDQLGLTNVQMITNTWGFDEMLYGLCGSPCVGIVHGILPFKAYVDASDDLKALHNKWRAVDAAADADAELPGSYENVRYVQGHVSVLMWKTAVERVVDSGKPVTGENLRAALEGFRDVPMFNLSAAVSFTSADHRPQSTVSFYKIGAGGTIVHEPPERTISLQPSWLGW